MSQSREHFTEQAFREPQGETEATVCAIVANVLGVDRVGRSDSFYDFGGTSLQAIRVCARIEAEIGCQAQPEWLFDHDIVADLAAKVDAERALASEPGA